MSFEEPESGPSWAKRARLPGLAAVIDHQDHSGVKNALIDRSQKRALARAAGRIGGRRALDFGCGTGRIAAWLSQAGAAVHGVDRSPEMVAAARDRAPGVDYSVLDGAELPFPPDRFDIVVSVTVMQYLVTDRARLVEATREIGRCLASSGRLLALEQVTGASLRRGGSVGDYVGCFEEAGFRTSAVRPVRLGASRVTRWASARPAFARLPFVPALMALEARTRGVRQLADDAYAEVLFVAHPS